MWNWSHLRLKHLIINSMNVLNTLEWDLLPIIQRRINFTFSHNGYYPFPHMKGVFGSASKNWFQLNQFSNAEARINCFLFNMIFLFFNWFWKSNTYWFCVRKSILHQFDTESNTHEIPLKFTKNCIQWMNKMQHFSLEQASSWTPQEVGHKVIFVSHKLCTIHCLISLHSCLDG